MSKYLRRHIDKELAAWAQSPQRKPLLLRGARQVGKTTAVRHLAERFDNFAEIDFNERHDIHYMFDGTYSPQEICQLLSIQYHTPIVAGKTLLFFDEIQACPQAINRGAIAETFVGNELVKSSPCYEPRPLYCWHREKDGSSAEVDYVVQLGENIRPIEVKSGIKGSMQSMRLFLHQKGIDHGIRCSLENFSSYDDIRVYPLYAIKNIFGNE